ncbi:GL17920 [Drosophila persimilis]|uniref:GL17920 n=1 Tax=Drosophila persimilis TaxID=7234 RepID=B4H1P6_DROPE|nr:GL17920 [Drosophila persimilis]
MDLSDKFFVIAFAVIAAASAASIATDYLPPVDNNLEAASEQVELPAAEQGLLSDDGYRYKTVRRLKLRHRRDVNELPTAEYLIPVDEIVVGVTTASCYKDKVATGEISAWANDTTYDVTSYTSRA